MVTHCDVGGSGVFAPPAAGTVYRAILQKHLNVNGEHITLLLLPFPYLFFFFQVRSLTAPSPIGTMTWDSRLAQVAAQHANGCSYGHTDNAVRGSRYNALTGEGMSVGEVGRKT
jgi:hypothetical protein